MPSTETALENAIIIVKRVEVPTAMHVKLLLMMYILLRLTRLEALLIICRDIENKLRQIIQRNTKVNWILHPAFEYIIKMASRTSKWASRPIGIPLQKKRTK